MPRYIDADKVEKWTWKEPRYSDSINDRTDLRDFLRSLPTISPDEVRGAVHCITLGEDGKEHFDQSKNHSLPPEIERMFPDYSIYPQFDFAVSMTSRGCPRGCSFCHVQAKEGCASRKVADVSDFWNGQREIKVLDPNITACREKRDLMRQYRETGAKE